MSKGVQTTFIVYCLVLDEVFEIRRYNDEAGAVHVVVFPVAATTESNAVVGIGEVFEGDEAALNGGVKL
jgi:hypothetical protein